MAVNKNLQSINLGAPASIEITENQYPNAELSVQIMSSCTDMTILDDGVTKCTRKGAMESAMDLLTQYVREKSIKTNLDGWSISFVPSSLYSAVKNGGDVSFFVSNAGEKVCWVIDGNTTEGLALDANGVLTIPRGATDTIIIKAIKWDDSLTQAVLALPLSQIAIYQSLTNMLLQYNALGGVVADRTEYAALLNEFPSLANSLVDTGKRSIIVQQTGSNAGYIDTGIVCSADMSFEVVARHTISGGTNYLFGGGGSTTSNRMYHFVNLNSGNKRAYFRYSATESNYTNAEWNEGFHKYKYDMLSCSVDSTLNMRGANKSAFTDIHTSPICIFGNIDNNNGTSYLRNTTANCTLEIERLMIRRNNDVHIFVPFVRGEKTGLIDLFDLSFHSNRYTRGEFTLNIEDK